MHLWRAVDCGKRCTTLAMNRHSAAFKKVRSSTPEFDPKPTLTQTGWKRIVVPRKSQAAEPKSQKL